MKNVKCNFHNKLAKDMLGSCIRRVIIEINVDISDLVQIMAFIQYLSLIMTSWTVVGL